MPKNKSTKGSSKSLLTGSIIAAFIAASPYFFYLYEGFPQTSSWETFLGTYTSNYYQNVYALGWTLFGKLIPLLLLFIWFWTCKHWWYHALLIPICMYVFQIYTVLREDMVNSDSIELFILAPLILIALVFLYTIRTKIFDRIHNIDFSELERGSIKGEINEENVDKPDPYVADYPSSFVMEDGEEYEDELEDDDDDEPLYMG
ncbi:MAG: hypothetical protein V7767_00895 [Leeuwenhoekiella sp.]